MKNENGRRNISSDRKNNRIRDNPGAATRRFKANKTGLCPIGSHLLSPSNATLCLKYEKKMYYPCRTEKDAIDVFSVLVKKNFLDLRAFN